MSARSLDTAWLATLPPRRAPWWARAWWPVVTFAGLCAVLLQGPDSPCTTAAPCLPDPVGDAGGGLLVAGATLTAVSGPGALAATVLGLAVGIGPGLPAGVWIAAAAHVAVQTAVVVRRGRRPHPPAAPAGPVGADLPSLAEPLPRLRTAGTLAASAAVLLMVLLAVLLPWREGAAQRDAPVVEGRVVAQDSEDLTVEVAYDGGGRGTAPVWDTADHPVGSRVTVWAFGDGSARPVAEPYDAWGASMGVGYALGLLTTTVARLRDRHRRLRAFRRRRQPAWRAQARLLPGVAFVHPLDAGPDDDPVLALALPLGEDEQGTLEDAWDGAWQHEELDEDEGEDEDEDEDEGGEPGEEDAEDLPDPVPVELAGLPLPGEWCALRVDGTWVPVLAPAAEGAWGPPLVLRDLDVDLDVDVDEDGLPRLAVPVEDLSEQDVAPLDGSVAVDGRHVTPLWVGLLSAVPALVVSAVGLDWVDDVAGWLAGWWPGTPFGPAVLRTLTAAALGLLALELVWWFRLRPRLRWDQDGLDVVPPLGHAVRYGWDSLVGADLVARGGLQLTLVTDLATGLAEGPGRGEFPASEVEVPVAATWLPAVLRRGWRTGPELRAALLQARGTARHDRRAPLRIDGPVRPVLPWVLWVAVVAASATGGWA